MHQLAEGLSLVTPELGQKYRSCLKKQSYATMDEATRVALHESQRAGGQELFAYHCQHDTTHFHLTHLPQTAEQLEALEMFTLAQQRRHELERRQLRRTIRELEGKILATRGRFKRQLNAVWDGTPFPSRIQAHYDGLRSRLDEWARYAADLMAAVYAYEGRAIIARTCADFDAPGSAWRRASESKLAELTAELTARAAVADEAYNEELRALDEMEARDLASCREALSERYAGADVWHE